MGLRIVIGADSAAVDYKEIIKKDLEADERVAEVIDIGLKPARTLTTRMSVSKVLAWLVPERLTELYCWSDGHGLVPDCGT